MASSSLNTLLKSLTRVGRAQPVHEVASADRMNAIQDAIRLLIRGENIIAGNNVLLKRSDGYVILTGNAAGRPGGGKTTPLPFAVIDATVVNPDNTVNLKVQVVDGKVNDEYPTGMGFGDFILDLVEETFQEVYLYITFDSLTLDITSRTIDVSDTPPDSSVTATVGTLILPLADITISYTTGPPSLPYVSDIHQIEIGDIIFQLVYGALNGAPALLPVRAYGDWVPVTA